MIKVYAKLDSNNIITKINSDLFLDSLDDYVLIDEGMGDRYAHAQNNYLPFNICDDKGRLNFKYLDGEVLALTENEKVNLFPDIVERSVLEVLKEENKLLKAQVNVLAEQGDFRDDLIAEIAMVIYA